MSENPVYIRGDWNADSHCWRRCRVRRRQRRDRGDRRCRDPAVEPMGGREFLPEPLLRWPAAVARTRQRTSAGTVSRSSQARGYLSRCRPSAAALPRTSARTVARTTSCDCWRIVRTRRGAQQTVNYLGSLATLYYNRQAVGRTSAVPRCTALRSERSASIPTSVIPSPPAAVDAHVS